MSRDELVVQPHVGVGLLRFGMRPEDVHGICGEPNWRRLPDESFGATREQFETYRFFVEFGREGGCCSVEMYPDVRVTLDGTDLMAMSYNEFVSFLRGRGVSIVEKGDGVRCDDLGLAGYAPQKSDPELSDAPIESLLVYSRGYYDELDALLAKSVR